MNTARQIRDQSTTNSSENAPFHATLKVGKTKPVSLALLKDELMAIEAAASDSSFALSGGLCGCMPASFASSKQVPAFTSIPYYHILSVKVTGSILRLAYASPTLSQKTHRDKSRPLFQLPVELATAEFTIHESETEAQIHQWVNELRSRAYGRAWLKLRVFVIINPFGGKGKALDIWEKKIHPLLAAAECRIGLKQTEYAGHAVEIAKGLDLDSWDVIACCSGDGVVCEVFNGLSMRPNPASALAKVSVFQLPCGSGNAMSYNLTGTVEPCAATIALLKGCPIPFDLMSVSQDGKRTMSFLSQSVGMIADCDVGTDHLRWMGPVRFTVGIIWRILRQSIYPCDIAFSPNTVGDKNQIRSQYLSSLSPSLAHSWDRLGAGVNEAAQRPPRDTQTSLSAPSCPKTSSVTSPLLEDVDPLPGILAQLSAHPPEPGDSHSRGRNTNHTSGSESGIVATTMYDHKASRNNSDHVRTASSAFADALSSASPSAELPIFKYGSVQDPLPSDWTLIQKPDLGTFYAGNMAYMADDAHFFPASKPADGAVDVVIISGRMGRRKGLEAVSCIEDGPKFFKLPITEYFKTDAFRVIPHHCASHPTSSSSSKAHGIQESGIVGERGGEGGGRGGGESLISIDGEPAPLTPFQVEIHKGLARVISLFGPERYASGTSWE